MDMNVDESGPEREARGVERGGRSVLNLSPDGDDPLTVDKDIAPQRAAWERENPVLDK